MMTKVGFWCFFGLGLDFVELDYRYLRMWCHNLNTDVRAKISWIWSDLFSWCESSYNAVSFVLLLRFPFRVGAPNAHVTRIVTDKIDINGGNHGRNGRRIRFIKGEITKTRTILLLDAKWNCEYGIYSTSITAIF